MRIDCKKCDEPFEPKSEYDWLGTCQHCSPGGKTAIENGCTCPVMDNGHGQGYYCQPGVFVSTGDCPLHPLGGAE